MNTYEKVAVWAKKGGIALAMTASTLLGLPVHAATSFPDYPLLTGGAGTAPNILLILDDSGSMSFVKMPDDAAAPDYCNYQGVQCGLNDNPIDRSYVNNTIYYNPAKTYNPWRTSSMTLTDRLANATVSAVVKSPTGLTGTTIDLRGNSESIFYVPTVASPGTDPANYDKYRIAASNSGNSVSGAVVQKYVNGTLLSGSVTTIAKSTFSQCFSVTTNSPDAVVIATSGGTGDGDLYVYSNGTCSGGYVGLSDGNTNAESVTYTNPPATISFRIYAYARVDSITYTATGSTWQDGTPLGHTQAAELQNFANWYQYARTRNKTAKAGASEAFGRLGSGYRVGFDSIWNRRNGTTINMAGSVPSYPIPYASSNGAFSGSNRDGFYSALQSAGASNSTPLHGALQRAARYFATDDPWKDSSGAMLSCRQNYAILTTDGFWNDQSGYTAVGNADSGSTYGDSYTDTLADVAFQYWKNDLRTDMTDNVRASSADPATWQHMVTFGVSIGQQGTLNPNNPPPSPWNVDPTSTEDLRRIDDLWHATLNGHGRFVVASDVQSFADALVSALSAIDARTASGSNAVSSSTRTDSSALTFLAGYTSSTWIGDMKASPYNSAFTGVSDIPLWVLSRTFAVGGVNATGFSSRTVLTTAGGVARNFNSSMPNAALYARSTGTDAVSATDNINYILGNQSLEVGQTNGVLRRRTYPLGDIVDSSPTYASSTNTVYVGANDGMLHGIDAATGKVLFSYVPAGVDVSALASLSSTSYTHRYFVDGQTDVSTNATNSSKNILIGALGRGGKGVYSLDVTSPTTMGTGNVLWDKSFPANDATGDADMGYVLGSVAIRQGNGGKIYAFVPNGIESANGSAVLFVYDINPNGTLNGVTKLDTGAAGGNGLMSIGLVDLNGDRKIDTVYGGDLKGNVWKWDFSGATPPASATKIFQATDASGTPQPITGGLDAARDSNGRIFVGFGTGRYISLSDAPGNPLYTAQTQSIYGVIDTGAAVARSDLQLRTIPFSGTDSSGSPARGFETYSALPAGKSGWVIDLPGANNERVITTPTVSGSALWITSMMPGSGGGCSGAQGSGYVNAVNIFTGTNPSFGTYFSDTTMLSGAANTTGGIGSVLINSGGAPTQVNVNRGLVLVGGGTFTADTGSSSTGGTGNGGGNGNGGNGNGNGNGGGSTSTGKDSDIKDFKTGTQSGGQPQRVIWREIVPTN